MLRACTLPCLIALALGLAVGCGNGADGSSGSTASGGSTTTPAGSPVPCGDLSCSPDEYCFKPWDCGAPACGGSCQCVCAPLPSSCPEDSPCSCPVTSTNTGFGGYFGNPSESFDGGADPYPDHQVSCYGS
jgi:hypothetical protein